MIEHYQAVVSFIMELEKLKNVERRIKPLGLSRYENSAEHSWQVALMAISLAPYAEQKVDILKVVTMLLVHDIVEIDTGDKFAYDAAHDDYENELQSAQRLFAILPAQQEQKFLALWVEFEQSTSPEALYAKSIDRMMPVLQNLNNGGQSWLEHNVSVAQILKKNSVIRQSHPKLWDWISEQVIAVGNKVGLARE
ncbi:HD domain-containing protein [Paraglaciecola aquimarina]|uniref:5'-deoxynucleotidase n=1 Tax=Paraglaciecola aquimarina TaxID=1235557 RepID=A0ABU3SSA9_9ALTE|nr:HD domain-containing protein [Paraglaciecola aquimarina]MDU0352889.1 HD domain-containing protein [Paraglaciecola aquimarina]